MLYFMEIPLSHWQTANELFPRMRVLFHQCCVVVDVVVIAVNIYFIVDQHGQNSGQTFLNTEKCLLQVILAH